MNYYLDMMKRFPNPSHLQRGQGSVTPSVLPPHLNRGGAPNTMEFNPEQSWWDKLSSGGIDWEQGIQDLAGMSFPTEEAGGMISGGKVGGRGGPTLADFSPTNMGGGAPNPGWPLVHPRRKEEQYAGPFVPTQIWSLG